MKVQVRLQRDKETVWLVIMEPDGGGAMIDLLTPRHGPLLRKAVDNMANYVLGSDREAVLVPCLHCTYSER